MKKLLLVLPFCFSTTVYAAEFACPKSGTIEQRNLGKLQYTGHGADPYVCKFMNYSNTEKTLLFNFYGLDPSSVIIVRHEMSKLLSGESRQVSFSYTSAMKYAWHDEWTFLRREKLTIAGQTFDAMVFDHDADQQSGNYLHGHYTRWFDPVNGLWLKASFRYVSGKLFGGSGISYQDVAITLP